MNSVQRIKILHVVLSLEPGGLENGLVNVARGLDRETFHVDVCCLERAGKFAKRLPPDSGIYPLGKPEGFSLRAVYGVARAIREVRPDIVHTHNLGNLIYGSFATGFGQTRPIVHSEHGELNDDDLNPRRLRQRRWFYRSCRIVQTVSEGLRQRLIELGFSSPDIRAIANGVDDRRFSPGASSVARSRLGLDIDAPTIGIVGRFAANKRHDLLLAAFECFSKHSPNAQLLVVGAGGSEYGRFTRLAGSSPCASRIHLVGFQEDPCPYYRAMDLLVLPSTVEGMSNVVLEAMACGVPVLSHSSCGATEMLRSGEDGFVAHLETPELLADQLRSILSDPIRLVLIGKNARATAVARFSLAGMVQQYERLYQETARAKPRFRRRRKDAIGHEQQRSSLD